MASSKYAYYAVRVGRFPGVYREWLACDAQVSGFSGGVYKKFSNEQEAYEFAGIPRPPPVAVPASRGPNPEARRAVAIARVVEQTKNLQQDSGAYRPTLAEALKEEDAVQDAALAAAERRKAEANARDVARLQAEYKGAGTKRPAYSRPESVEASVPKRIATERPAPSAAPTRPIEAARGSTVTVWTDGGCYNNGGPNAAAGIGVFWGPGDPRNVGEPLPGHLHSSQRGELGAALRALNDTAHFRETGTALLIITDSMYTINCVTAWLPNWKRNGWRSFTGSPVLNRDLIMAIDAARQGRVVNFKHVRGHRGIYGNENSDILASKGVEMARAARRQ